MTAASIARSRAAQVYRRTRDQLDDVVVRQARQLVQQYRSRPPAVLHFGASESVFVGVDDADPRPLPAMLAGELADLGPVHTLTVAGMQPDLIEAYLHLVPDHERPVLLMAMPLRVGLPQWRRHPYWSREYDIAAVRSLRSRVPAVSMRRPRRRLPDEAMQRYDDLVLHTFAGTRTCGEWRTVLRAGPSSMSEREFVRLRYAYFWGGVDPVDATWTDAVERLFRYCASRSLTVVPYLLRCSLSDALEVWDGFGDYVERNSILEQEAASRGMPGVRFEDPTRDMDRSCYIDPDDAAEHFNERGRRELLARLAERVRRTG